MATLGLKERLLAAPWLVGTHITLTDPAVSAVLSRAGFDFVLLEADNTESSYTTLRNHLATLRSGGLPALVRGSIICEYHINRVLELGPEGIILPGINTAAEAKRAVSMTLYPPEGTRRFNLLRSVAYKIEEAYELALGENQRLCRIIQLDTAESLRNIAEIAEVERVDGFFFAPGSFIRPDGRPEALYGPDTEELISRAAEMLRQKRIPYGVSLLKTGPGVLDFWLKLGACIFAVGFDAGYIAGGARENLISLKSQLPRLTEHPQN